MKPKILCLETTCDETAAAIVDESLEVVASVVASQDALHQRFQGVVPEIAARAHLERILPVVHETLEQAGLQGPELAAVAVAHTPGLAGSLIVGTMAAKALALAWNLPLIGIDHLHAHIYACRMARGEDVFPCVGFVVSGGHSNFYDCRTPTDFRYLGGTIDDAAGEAFDKVASLLQLPYPGGPAISRVAAQGDPRAFALPRPLLQDQDRLAFSFSGLKTAVRYKIMGPGKPDRDPQPLDPQFQADLAASFQDAVVDCLVGKAELAMRQTHAPRLCVGGGVAANRVFRERLEATCHQHGWDLTIAPLSLCTDNAVMGAIAWEHLQQGVTHGLELEVLPGLDRGPGRG